MTVTDVIRISSGFLDETIQKRKNKSLNVHQCSDRKESILREFVCASLPSGKVNAEYFINYNNALGKINIDYLITFSNEMTF